MYMMKPCPFCGAGGEHLSYVLDGHFHKGVPSGNVHCTPCGTKGPRGAPSKDAIAKWNDSFKREWRPMEVFDWSKQG